MPDQVVALVPGIDLLPLVTLMQDRLVLDDRPQEDQSMPTSRLVVLVPEEAVDLSRLARRIWQLAAGSGLHVLYVTLAGKEQWSAIQHRRLAELAALTSDKCVQAQGMVSDLKHWRQALENLLKPGDLLVCLSAHQVTGWMGRHAGLGQYLAGSLSRPVYLLGDVDLPGSPRWPARFKTVWAWIASITSIALFFALQLNIDHSALKPVSMIILCLSVVGEIYFLARINEWIG